MHLLKSSLTQVLVCTAPGSPQTWYIRDMETLFTVVFVHKRFTGGKIPPICVSLMRKLGYGRREGEKWDSTSWTLPQSRVASGYPGEKLCPGSRGLDVPKESLRGKMSSCDVHITMNKYMHVDRYTHKLARTCPQGSWLISIMHFQVDLVILLLQEVLAAHGASALLLAVHAPHMAVVGCVWGKDFAAVLALEGLLPWVLADVSAQDAGCGECLKR